MVYCPHLLLHFLVSVGWYEELVEGLELVIIIIILNQGALKTLQEKF